MRAILLSIVFLSGLLAGGPDAQSADDDFEGAWRLVLERPGIATDVHRATPATEGRW